VQSGVKPKRSVSREKLYIIFIIVVALAGLAAYYFFNNKISADTASPQSTAIKKTIAINNWDKDSEAPLYAEFSDSAQFSCSEVTVYLSSDTLAEQKKAVDAIIAENNLNKSDGTLSAYINSLIDGYKSDPEALSKTVMLGKVKRSANPSDSFPDGVLKTKCDRGGGTSTTKTGSSTDYSPALKVPAIYTLAAAAATNTTTVTASATTTTSSTAVADTTTKDVMIIPKINVYQEGKTTSIEDWTAINYATINIVGSQKGENLLVSTSDTKEKNYLENVEIKKPTTGTDIKIYATKKTVKNPNGDAAKTSEIVIPYSTGKYSAEINSIFANGADISATAPDSAVAEPMTAAATGTSSNNFPVGTNTLTFYAARYSSAGEKKNHTPIGGVNFKISLTTSSNTTAALIPFTSKAFAQTNTQTGNSATQLEVPYDSSLVTPYDENTWQKLQDVGKSALSLLHLSAQQYNISGTIADNGTKSGIEIDKLPSGQYKLTLSKNKFTDSTWMFSIAKDKGAVDLGGLTMKPQDDAEPPSIASNSVVRRNPGNDIYFVDYNSKTYGYTGKASGWGWQPYTPDATNFGMKTTQPTFDANGIPHSVGANGNENLMTGSVTSQQMVDQYSRCISTQVTAAGMSSDLTNVIVGIGLGYFADSDTGARTLGKLAKDVGLSVAVPYLLDKILGTNVTGKSTSTGNTDIDSIISKCKYIIYGTSSTATTTTTTQPQWTTSAACNACSLKTCFANGTYTMQGLTSATGACSTCLTCLNSSPTTSAIAGLVPSFMK
jgi:hypothetical protein